MTLTKPKAIIFDWDNTLADTWPIIHESFTYTLNEMGESPWTFEETKKRVHRSMRDSFPEIFGDKWEKAVDVYQGYFRANHIERLSLLPGSEMIVKMLSQAPVYTAIVSNKKGVNLRKEIDHIEWQGYFDKIVGANDAVEDKPSPAPIRMALEGSDIELNEDVWLIGDSITDLECAYNSGITPIFYGDADLTEERFANHQPKRHLKDHSELESLIKELGVC